MKNETPPLFFRLRKHRLVLTLLTLFLFATTTTVVAMAIWHLTIVAETPQDVSFYAAPVIYEQRVAWLEEIWGQSERGFRINVKELDTGHLYDLSEALPCETDDVRLDATWVIAELICPHEWNTIHAYNLETEEHIVIAPFSLDPLTQDFQPAVDDGNVVWLHAEAPQRDIYIFNLDSRVKSQVTNDTQWETHPDISGDWVVWEDYARDIYAYNISTNERVTVTHDAITQQWPRVDGDLVAWEDARNGDWDIYGFDLSTRQEIALVTGEGDQIRGLPSGDILSYVNDPDPTYHHEGAAIHALHLKTNEITVVHVFEDGEFYAPEQYRGDMVWIFSPVDSEVDEVRLAKYLRNQFILPVVFHE